MPLNGCKYYRDQGCSTAVIAAFAGEYAEYGERNRGENDRSPRAAMNSRHEPDAALDRKLTSTSVAASIRAGRSSSPRIRAHERIVGSIRRRFGRRRAPSRQTPAGLHEEHGHYAGAG